MTIKQSIWSIWGCLMFLSKASFNSSSASVLGRVHQGHWSHQTTKSCCLEVQHVSSRVKTMEIYGDHGVLSGTKHCQTQRKQHFSSTVWLKDPFRSLNSLVQAWPNQTCRHIPTFRTAGSLHVDMASGYLWLSVIEFGSSQLHTKRLTAPFAWWRLQVLNGFWALGTQ